MAEKYYWAEYGHIIAKEDLAACFNALKMRPVFIPLKEAESIKHLCANGATIDVLKKSMNIANVDEIIVELIKAKVIYKGRPRDIGAGRKFGEIAAANTSVQYLYLILTDACNLNCSYCFLRNRNAVHATGQKMSEEIAKLAAVRFSEQLLSAKTPLESGQVVFYGGEPLINFPALKAFVEALEDIRAKTNDLPSIIYTMTTNATLVTEKIARYLAKHKIAVGVSIDGPEELMMDRCTNRNKNPSSEVIRGIKLLQKEGVSVGASCTLTERVVKNFDNVLDHLLNTVGFRSLSFNMILPNPDGGFDADYCERATKAMIKSWELCQEKGANEDRITRKVRAIKKYIPYPYDCAACGSQIFVDPSGRIGLCQGTLGREDKMICDVHRSFDLSDYPLYEKWRRRTPLLMDGCQQCPGVGICGGGCALAAESVKGNIYERDERFCVHTRICLEWLIWGKLFPYIKKNKFGK